MGVEFFTGSGQVIRSGFESTKGGTFGCGWCVGLELLGEKGDQRSVEGPCLGRLVGDSCALCCMNGFGDRI